MEKPKTIAAYRFKSTSNAGNPCKTTYWVKEDGSTVINQLFLLPENEDGLNMVKLCTKFGKTLWVTGIAFKFGSLMKIAAGAHATMEKQKKLKYGQ